jgi:hypothetical protein
MGFHRRNIDERTLRLIYSTAGADGIERLFNGKYDALSLNDNISMEVYRIFRSHFTSEVYKWQLIRDILK